MSYTFIIKAIEKWSVKSFVIARKSEKTKSIIATTMAETSCVIIDTVSPTLIFNYPFSENHTLIGLTVGMCMGSYSTLFALSRMKFRIKNNYWSVLKKTIL